MRLPPIFPNFVDKERDYFFSIAREHEKELSLHESSGGLWEKNGNGKDWANVTEHCLMAAARAGALARLLGLPDALRASLVSAAAVHDFNKKEDIRLTREDIAAGGSGRKGALASGEESEKILRAADFPELISSLVNCVSGDPKDVYRMKDFLDLAEPSPENIAHFAIHYIDNYTRGSFWAEAADYGNNGGVNDIDRRNVMNASNPSYEKMNKEGLVLNKNHPFFRGMTRFEAAAAVNHLIEKKLAEIIRKRGIDIKNPLDLPELIDKRIKEDIETSK